MFGLWERAQLLAGVIVDDEEAKFVGAWTASDFGDPLNGASHYDGNEAKGEKQARFTVEVPAVGRYEVRIAYTPGANRATNVPIEIGHAGGLAAVKINQKTKPLLDGHFVSLGTFEFAPLKPVQVTVGTVGTDGFVAVNALQVIKVK